MLYVQCNYSHRFTGVIDRLNINHPDAITDIYADARGVMGIVLQSKVISRGDTGES